MGFDHEVINQDHENQLKHKHRHYVYDVNAHRLISYREALPVMLNKSQKGHRVVVLLDIKDRVFFLCFGFFEALLNRQALEKLVCLALFLLDALEVL
jgi:hypothetical protein